MARRLGATPFRELLAQSIAEDPTIRAAADALDGVLNAVTCAIPRMLLYARLAHATGRELLPPLARLAEQTDGLAALDDRMLELLAWQLHVEGFEVARTARAKEALVNASVPIHRLAGTPWALRRALELALETEVLVPEWFQYGGRPYFFKVRFPVPQTGLSEARLRDVFRLILARKNVRSWLEVVETEMTLPLPERVGVGLQSLTKSRFPVFFSPPSPPVMRPCVVIGLRGRTTTSASPLHFHSPPPPAAYVRCAACLSGITATRVAWKATDTGIRHG